MIIFIILFRLFVYGLRLVCVYERSFCAKYNINNVWIILRVGIYVILKGFMVRVIKKNSSIIPLKSKKKNDLWPKNTQNAIETMIK